MRTGALTLAMLTLSVATVGAQVVPRIRPPGVTDSAIAWGDALFHGSANCSRCHGTWGRGSEYGPALTDAIWLHGPGTFNWLVQEVNHGIPENWSVSGIPMPSRGAEPMPEGDVRAVAAYVWSISHPPQPPSREPPSRN